jgi:hypothetical protein
MKLEELKDEYRSGRTEIVTGGLVFLSGIVLESVIEHAMVGGLVVGGALMVDGFRRINKSEVE